MKLTCVVVNAGRAVKVEAEGESSLDILQALVGGLIDLAHVSSEDGSDSIDCYVNDEGLLIDLPPQGERYFECGTFAGALVYAGSREGETISLTDDQVSKILGAYS